MDDEIERLEVRRDDLRSTRIVTDEFPSLGEGQALLRVDRFGLTSNNVTYGVAGDLLGYWDFFPAADGWGRIPVWGYAEVVDSRVETLAPGTRVFGYLPMASHLVVEPTRVSATGFTDVAGRRAALPAVYNRYRATDADPMHSPDTEDLQVVFVPLFATSFVLDDYLADHDDFGAQRIVISSASSKTATGTALCTSRREGRRPHVVGLTSPANVGFVTGLGCFDTVVAYDDIESLDPSIETAFVDVAGDAEVRGAVHRHLGDRLRASCSVGLTHWDASASSDDLPGPTPTRFFAPTQIEKRVKDWGPAGYQDRLSEAWSGLLEVVGEWIAIVEVRGLGALRDGYLRLLDGAARPDQAIVVDMRAADGEP